MISSTDINEPINIRGMSALVNRSKIDNDKQPLDIEDEILNVTSEFNDIIVNNNNKDSYLEDFENQINNINNIENYSPKGNQFNLNENEQPSNSFNQPSFNEQPSSTSFNQPSFNQPSFNQQPSTSFNQPSFNQPLSNSFNQPSFNQPPSTSFNQPSFNQQQKYPYPNQYNNFQIMTNQEEDDDCEDDDYDEELIKEKEKDKKILLLENIHMLKEELRDDGENINNIKHVDEESRIQDIEYVYKVLSIKMNRKRYTSITEEVILTGVNLLETVFNGENKLLGTQLDLVGYSSVAKQKLRKMRGETTTIVGDTIEKMELNFFTKLIIELVPSMFLFSKTKKLQKQNQFNIF